VGDTAEEAAAELKLTMLELLRQLNRSEMERQDVAGVELEELRFLLSRARLPQLTLEEAKRAMEVLVANGYARELTDPEYAWSRGRTVRERFTITTEGKEFLLHEIERTGRVE